MSRKILIRLPIILGGMGIILISIFAFRLGFDNDPGWGTGRFKMLVLGLGISFFGAYYWFGPIINNGYADIKGTLKKHSFFQALIKLIRQIRSQIENIIHFICDSSFAVRISTSGLYKWFSQKLTNIGLVLLGCCIVWIYIWIITIGSMDKWPSGKDYYWKLSQAFQQGQTHLLVEPSPELLQLENPYDLQQRNGIEYLWDTSFYKGKYYLYWGPIPAVIGVLVSSITSKPVTDTGLVFLFVIGIASFSVLLLRDIHRKYKYPAWVFWGGVIASTVNIPLIWLLTRPKFYEVSIVGGQCFLMMGFFALFRAFRSPMLNKGHIVLASLSFGLAGATRINLLPSVIFLAIVIFWRIFVANQKKINFSLPALTAAFLPLALVACFMLWYNYDRFDSIFEFGHRYQLTGSSLPPNYKDTSSANYIIPNLYSYVFRPPSLDREFPFLTVPWVKENMWPYFIHIPEHYYYTEPVAGILFIVPLVGLALLFLARYFWLLVNGDLSVPEIGDGGHENQISWYRFSMLGCFLIQAFILVIFINSAMRYLFDISTLLIVLSVIFMGSYLHTFAQNKFQIRIAALLWILVSMLTVLAGFIIGFTGDENNFLNQNPSLYYQWLERFGG